MVDRSRLAPCLALFAACTAPRPVTVAVLTDLSGVTEPCGCTSRPLGGLDRVAALVTSEKPAALLVVGDTFYTPEAAAHQAKAEAAKAVTIDRLLRRLEPVALVPGRHDAAWSAAHRGEALQGRAASRTVSLGGLQVGLLGVTGTWEAEAVAAQAAAMRRDGAVLVLLLAAVGGGVAPAAVPGVDGIVWTGGERPPGVQRVGDTPVFFGGSKGERLALLRLTPRPGQPWRFFDGGRGERAALSERRERLQAEATALPEGPARAARRAKVAQLDAAVAAVQSAPPSTSWFDWTWRDVDASVPRANWAQAMLADYNRSLCDATRQAESGRLCAPVPDASGRFAGNNDSCRACHAPAFAVYEKTAHAHAWRTLTRVGRECDTGCIGCHTVGYDKPGGFCRLDDAAAHANVGCESCHGPAALHAQQGVKTAQLVRAPGEAVCRSCHTPSHSDKFDLASYLPRILGPGHGAAP